MSEVKEEFWSKLDGVVHSIPRVEKPVIGADFSEHVGGANRADEKVLGRCSAQERNVEGQMFAWNMEMDVVKMYFRKREEHRVT